MVVTFIDEHRRDHRVESICRQLPIAPSRYYEIKARQAASPGRAGLSKHIGSKFDDFLDEEGLLAEAEAVAAKRMIAFQLSELMKKQKLTKMQLAKRMKTSRSALERLLDPYNIPLCS